VHLRSVNCAMPAAAFSQNKIGVSMSSPEPLSSAFVRSAAQKLEIFNMPLTQRCNYAGSLGKPVPTRSFLSAVSRRLRSLVVPLPRLRH
jgi:hypothetical protein